MGITEFSGWGALGAAAVSGDLLLERGVAQRCAARCEQLVRELQALKDQTVDLTTITGFGDKLASGIALAAKFERKASGGEYSLDTAIGDHIAVVNQMRDVFLQIEARYAAAEEANTAATTAVGSRID